MIKENIQNLSKATEKAISHKIGILSEFLELINAKLEDEYDSITDTIVKLELDNFSSSDDFNQYADFLSDQNNTLDNIKSLSFQLAIISLYRIVELGTKNQLLHLYNKKEVRKLYRWDVFTKKLFKDYGIDIKKLKYYSETNELRTLNNAIKHENLVTKELTNFQGWNFGDELGDLKNKYEEFAPKMPIYMSNLISKIIIAKK